MPTPEPRRAVIDPALCIGSGSCEFEDGAYFQVAGDCLGHVRGAPGDLDEDTLVRIADSCPARAITVVSADGSPVWRP